MAGRGHGTTRPSLPAGRLEGEEGFDRPGEPLGFLDDLEAQGAALGEPPLEAGIFLAALLLERGREKGLGGGGGVQDRARLGAEFEERSPHARGGSTERIEDRAQREAGKEQGPTAREPFGPAGQQGFECRARMLATDERGPQKAVEVGEARPGRERAAPFRAGGER